MITQAESLIIVTPEFLTMDLSEGTKPPAIARKSDDWTSRVHRLAGVASRHNDRDVTIYGRLDVEEIKIRHWANGDDVFCVVLSSDVELKFASKNRTSEFNDLVVLIGGDHSPARMVM